MKRLARSLQLDVKGAETEFKRLLPAALAAREAKRVAGVTAANGDGVVTAQERDIVVDNREAWGEILDSPCMGSCQVLPRLIRTYQAVPLGTPDVERNLGKLTELLREHSGANNGASFHMLLEGALELDEKEEDVFGRDVASTQVLLRFTETSRSWQRMCLRARSSVWGLTKRTNASGADKSEACERG